MAKKSRFPGPKMMSSKESRVSPQSVLRMTCSRIRDIGPYLIAGVCCTTTWSACFKMLEQLGLGRRQRHVAFASDVSRCLSRKEDDTPATFPYADYSRPNDNDPRRDKPQTYGTSHTYGQPVDQL